jgi:hypothetical protein
MFGGKKFKKWQKENPSGLAEAIAQTGGSAEAIEDLLNAQTDGECQKQVHEFIIGCVNDKILSKDIDRYKKEIKGRVARRGYGSQTGPGSMSGP